jgi:hypothetical protein
VTSVGSRRVGHLRPSGPARCLTRGRPPFSSPPPPPPPPPPPHLPFAAASPTTGVRRERPRRSGFRTRPRGVSPRHGKKRFSVDRPDRGNPPPPHVPLLADVRIVLGAPSASSFRGQVAAASRGSPGVLSGESSSRSILWSRIDQLLSMAEYRVSRAQPDDCPSGGRTNISHRRHVSGLSRGVAVTIGFIPISLFGPDSGFLFWSREGFPRQWPTTGPGYTSMYGAPFRQRLALVVETVNPPGCSPPTDCPTFRSRYRLVLGPASSTNPPLPSPPPPTLLSNVGAAP